MTGNEPASELRQDAGSSPRGTLGRREVLTTATGATLVGIAGVPRLATARSPPGEELWNASVGIVESSPAAAGGTVFAGSHNANLHALDGETGEERWSFGEGASRRSSPTVVDGTVFVGGFDGSVFTVDAESGAEQWRFETGGGVFSSPAVVDGTVFVGSRDGNVYALDAGTGDRRWRHETGDEVWADPTVADG